jgi:hypothetical protein
VTSLIVVTSFIKTITLLKINKKLVLEHLDQLVRRCTRDPRTYLVSSIIKGLKKGCKSMIYVFLLAILLTGLNNSIGTINQYSATYLILME